MATRKKRSENGRRADPTGSKPHSYGDNFSWSGVIRGSQNETMAKTVDNAMAISAITESCDAPRELAEGVS